MPAALADLLASAAEKRGMSTAALVRLVAAEAVGAVDLLSKRRSPPRSRHPAVAENETDARLMVRALGRLCDAVAVMPESTDQAKTLAEIRDATRQATGAVKSCR